MCKKITDKVMVKKSTNEKIYSLKKRRKKRRVVQDKVLFAHGKQATKGCLETVPSNNISHIRAAGFLVGP